MGGFSKRSEDGISSQNKSTGNAGWTLEQGVGAGERNPASLVNGYVDTRKVSFRTNMTAAGPSSLGGSVAASDLHLRAILVVIALAGTVTITGFQDQAGVAQSLVLPIGFVGRYELDDSLNDKGACNVTLSSAVDYTTNKSVWIMWRPA